MSAPAAKACRVLAVDDEPEVTLLIARVLGRDGYEVIGAGSGEEALERARLQPPDLLIVDKNLPRMNGFELIRQVRGLYPNIPAIIITAAPEAHPPRAERLDGYLAKPFRSLDALRGAAAEALERSRAALERQELQRRLSEVVAQLRRP
jgi:CheY-like chemotaxis protein